MHADVSSSHAGNLVLHFYGLFHGCLKSVLIIESKCYGAMCAPQSSDIQAGRISRMCLALSAVYLIDGRAVHNRVQIPRAGVCRMRDQYCRSKAFTPAVAVSCRVKRPAIRTQSEMYFQGLRRHTVFQTMIKPENFGIADRQ